MLKRFSMLIGAMGLFPASLAAHPVHTDGLAYGMNHFLASPDHVAVAVLLLGTMTFVTVRAARKRN